MKTLLCAEVFADDDDFVARPGLVRFDLGNSWALAPVTDGVSLDFCRIGSFDRFSIEEGESCAIHHRA
jgi:hypothetical protein